jgi:hypothetical protein
MTNPLLRAFCSKCGKNGMECECTTFHPNIIVDEGETVDSAFIERYLVERQLGCKVLTVEECSDLVKYVYDQGYISHEFHPNMHKIVSSIEDFLNANSAQNKGRKTASRK